MQLICPSPHLKPHRLASTRSIGALSVAPFSSLVLSMSHDDERAGLICLSPALSQTALFTVYLFTLLFVYAPSHFPASLCRPLHLCHSFPVLSPYTSSSHLLSDLCIPHAHIPFISPFPPPIHPVSPHLPAPCFSSIPLTPSGSPRSQPGGRYWCRRICWQQGALGPPVG